MQQELDRSRPTGAAFSKPRWSHGEQAWTFTEDVELAESVEPADRRLATEASVAHVLRLPAGAWELVPPPAGAESGIGLLVLSGLLRRRMGWSDRRGVELLAAGDVLRPWEYADHVGTLLPLEDDWRVLAPSRLAILDGRWTARMARWPAIQGMLTARALERAHRAVTLMALTQVRQLDLRLWMLLWYLAERFGRVCPDGIRLELPITHQTLAELAGARRPSASAALARLSRAGCMRQLDHTWILFDAPPGIPERPPNAA